jgi:hypothetical protein
MMPIHPSRQINYLEIKVQRHPCYLKMSQPYLGLAEKVLNTDGLVDTERLKPIEVQGKSG